MSVLERPILESYWVLPGQFLAGEYPGRFHIEKSRPHANALLEAGFNTFIDLTRPDELPPYDSILKEQAGLYEINIQHLRFSIGDFGLPTRQGMKATLDAIDSALGAGRKVYLHCWAGVGRTGTTVGCYLVRHGKTGAQALQQLANWWQDVPKSQRYTRSPETDEQVRFILDWKE
ncbi:MAG: dual specificity protein phosphatase family protein [Chloroflexi bacterium]|nr:dual specificity protein phosphatase family protein [Chloroflexota bacterium]